MSAPETRLISDERAERITSYVADALQKKEWLPPVALEFALTTEALLRDREARCELMASANAQEAA